MKYTSAVLLAAASQAAAGAISHQHSRGKVHNHALRHAEIKAEAHLGKRDILSDASGFVTGLGAKLGINAAAPTSNAWLGSEGPYTNEFTNDSGQSLVLFCWGPAGSWVNAVAPLITHPLGPNESVTVSYAEGASGACSAVYPDTTMVNGQIFNTWIEYTFAGIYSTYDVSREVNMNGRGISTVGPTCTTNMDTCVFKCKDESVASCEKGSDYDLFNCAAGNGGGGGFDTIMQGTGGGCSMGSSSEKVTVTFS